LRLRLLLDLLARGAYLPARRDPDSKCVTNTDRYADSFPNASFTNSYGNSDSYAYCCAYPYCYRYCYSCNDTHSDARRNTDAYSWSNANAGTDTNTNTNCNPIPDPHA